jgi:hypothetical protein
MTYWSINRYDTYSFNSRDNRAERRTAVFGLGITGGVGRATRTVFLALTTLGPGGLRGRELLLLGGAFSEVRKDGHNLESAVEDSGTGSPAPEATILTKVRSHSDEWNRTHLSTSHSNFGISTLVNLARIVSISPRSSEVRSILSHPCDVVSPLLMRKILVYS